MSRDLFTGETRWDAELEHRIDRDAEREPRRFSYPRPTRLDVLTRQLRALTGRER